MRMRYARVPKTQTSVLSTLLKHLSFVDIPQAGATLKKTARGCRDRGHL
jgi:hypothetical protein